MTTANYVLGAVPTVDIDLGNGTTLHFDNPQLSITMRSDEYVFTSIEGSSRIVPPATEVAEIQLEADLSPQDFEEKNEILIRKIRGDL